MARHLGVDALSLFWIFSMSERIIQRTHELEKLAGKKGRKQLEAELSKARKDVNKATVQYNTSKGQLNSLEKQVEKAEKKMQDARHEISRLSKMLQHMDLTGAEEVRERPNDVSYVIDGKEMHIDISDVNDVKITPWRQYLKKRREDSSNSDDEHYKSDDEGEAFDIAFVDDEGFDLDITSSGDIKEATFQLAVEQVRKSAGR